MVIEIITAWRSGTRGADFGIRKAVRWLGTQERRDVGVMRPVPCQHRRAGLGLTPARTRSSAKIFPGGRGSGFGIWDSRDFGIRDFGSRCGIRESLAIV